MVLFIVLTGVVEISLIGASIALQNIIRKKEAHLYAAGTGRDRRSGKIRQYFHVGNQDSFLVLGI